MEAHGNSWHLTQELHLLKNIHYNVVMISIARPAGCSARFGCEIHTVWSERCLVSPSSPRRVDGPKVTEISDTVGCPAAGESL